MTAFTGTVIDLERALMAESFTHYWERRTFERQLNYFRCVGDTLQHTAGNQFRKRFVRCGDAVYVISFAGGELHLVGCTVVDRIVSESEAARRLQCERKDLWENAADHVLGTGSKLFFNLVVPKALVKKIRFVDGDGHQVTPALNRDGEIDPQTFRGVRRLAPETAAMFDHLLASHAASLQFRETVNSGEGFTVGQNEPILLDGNEDEVIGEMTLLDIEEVDAGVVLTWQVDDVSFPLIEWEATA